MSRLRITSVAALLSVAVAGCGSSHPATAGQVRTQLGHAFRLELAGQTGQAKTLMARIEGEAKSSPAARAWLKRWASSENHSVSQANKAIAKVNASQ